ncbi:chloramphenicol phosphotransferase [Rathayibacter tanaceti]|uniref:Chloramphenicol phosphotransferase n=1 Tax=Rathayibacter tanaceti TaxID=1671680 RepID=A0AAE6V7G9_9MICO|nr:chloramphenicol phosphotransferase [Rathayibacter tanaceti]
MIVLNGGSSSGKSTIARHLQAVLSEPWLSFSIDDLVDALPPHLDGGRNGVSYGEDGEVALGDGFRRLEAAWLAGLAATARSGAGIVLEDVLLDGGASQDRLRGHLAGLDVLWVGVRCSPAVATAREVSRGDRTPGMAARQADAVHADVRYDAEVWSDRDPPAECARLIVAALHSRPPS